MNTSILSSIRMNVRDKSHRYMLMHADIDVMEIEFRDNSIVFVDHVYNTRHIPPNVTSVTGHVLPHLLNDWLIRRSMPNDRTLLPRQQKPPSPETTLSLSLHDAYWLRPIGAHLGWAETNRFENNFTRKRHPDYATNGQLPKTWLMEKDARYLLKDGNAKWTHQQQNEVIGSELCRKLGIRHVVYDIFKRDGHTYSSCPCAIGPNEDYITAFDIVGETRAKHQCSDIGTYIKELEKHGLNARKILSQMCLVDVLMRNEDRHWNNFGIIRDAYTLRWKCAFPLFDFGNSLWFKSEATLMEPTSKFTQLRLLDDLAYVFDVTPQQLSVICEFPRLVSKMLETSELDAYHRNDLYRTLEQRTQMLMQKLSLASASFLSAAC